jgi:anaerobic selenocysteine-containing dehydrogenase
VDKIRKSALMYATQGPSTIGWGVAVDQQGWNATYAGMAKMLLRSFTNNLDINGGDYIPEPGPVINGKFPVRDCELELAEKVSPRRKKLIGGGRPSSWWQVRLLDKPYREMWASPAPGAPAPLLGSDGLEACSTVIRTREGRDLLVREPDDVVAELETGHKALRSLELFVVLEYFKTPTAALADYILPAADWMERPLCSTVEDSADIYLGGDRAVQPHADRRMDYDFFRALGMRLGQENDWPWETYEEVVAHRLERVGITYEEFCETGFLPPGMQEKKHEMIREKDGQVRGFATASRRLEIYPSAFETLGYDPIPRYREPAESPFSTPELAKEYPIILTTGGRWSPMFHSSIGCRGPAPGDVPWPIFRFISKPPVTWDRRRRLALIESPRTVKQGEDRFDVAPGVIIAQPSWWFPGLPRTRGSAAPGSPTSTS